MLSQKVTLKVVSIPISTFVTKAYSYSSTQLYKLYIKHDLYHYVNFEIAKSSNVLSNALYGTDFRVFNIWNGQP